MFHVGPPEFCYCLCAKLIITVIIYHNQGQRILYLLILFIHSFLGLRNKTGGARAGSIYLARVVIPNLLFHTHPAGGGLHWLHAHSAGTWPGEGDQEKGGALRPGTLCHCTVTLDLPAPSKGPTSTDVGDSMTSMKGYFFIPGLSRLLWRQQST